MNPASAGASGENHDWLLRRAGVAPTGWISPRDTCSPASSRLLAKAGYLHHGDFNDDDPPYVMDFGGRRIAAIPLTMDVNDVPTCICYGHVWRHMLDTFQHTFAAFRERETVPLMLDVTAHAQVMGRPSVSWVYDEIMRRGLAADDVWVCSREEIARYVLETTRMVVSASPHVAD
jgi:hypothetical protein